MKQTFNVNLPFISIGRTYGSPDDATDGTEIAVDIVIPGPDGTPTQHIRVALQPEDLAAVLVSGERANVRIVRLVTPKQSTISQIK